MVGDQVLPRRRDQHRELLQQLERLEEEVRAPVVERVLALVGEPAAEGVTR